MPSPSFADQRRFCSCENSDGNGFSDAETPPAFSPRNWVQSSAAAQSSAAMAGSKKSAAEIAKLLLIKPPHRQGAKPGGNPAACGIVNIVTEQHPVFMEQNARIGEAVIGAGF